MMRILRRIGSGSGLMLLATILGVATAAAAFAWLDTQRSEAEAEAAAAMVPLANTEAVVIVRVPVAAGTSIEREMLELRDVPLEAVLPGALRSIDDAADRVARYPLVEGEQILPSRIVTSESEASTGLAFAIPAGMRGLSVPVSEVSGAGGLIVPGDRVDVLVSTEYGKLFGPFELITTDDDDDVKTHPTVITVLQDVLVLAIGQQTTPPAEGDRDQATLRAEGVEVQPQAASATLAVNPEQAQMLFMASQQGVLGLSLRSFGQTSIATLDPLFRLEPIGAASTGIQTSLPTGTPAGTQTATQTSTQSGTQTGTQSGN
jgi:pilus assembly protein CpaB